MTNNDELVQRMKENIFELIRPNNVLSLLAERTADKAEISQLNKYLKQANDSYDYLRKELEKSTVRIAELETVCAESYQVVGALADAVGVFETSDAVSKALDNLSGARLVHSDVLPFSVEARTVSVKLPRDITHVTNKYFEEGRDAVLEAIESQLAAAGIKLEVGE